MENCLPPVESQPAWPRGASAIMAVSGALLIILALVFLNAVPDSRADQANDPFTYLSLARGLLTGDGYPSKHWMPGFSVMLAGLVALFGANWVALKLAMLGISLVGVLLSFRLFRTQLPAVAAWPLALVLAATPLYFDYSHRAMSEIPALVSAVAALLALHQLKSAVDRRGWIAWSIALAVASVVALLIRGNALALAPALLVGVINLRPTAPQARWGMAAACAALLLTYGAWSWQAGRQQYVGIHNVSYTQEIQARDIEALWNTSGEFGPGVERVDAAGFARRIYQNIAWHSSFQVAGLLAPTADRLQEINYPGLGFVLVALLLIPQLVGFVQLARRSPELATFLLCSVGMIIVYPTGGATRMLLPFLPVLLLNGYLGLERLLGAERAVAWLLCLLVSNIALCAIAADQQRQHPYANAAFGDFVNLVTNELPQALRPQEPVGADLQEELHALTGVRPQGIAALSAHVAAGRQPAALIVHTGGYIPSRELVATELASSGQARLLRITRRGPSPTDQ
ncbi:MAG TPA: hypothetical protein VL096_16130 [Pirellulaceae bacterium]|nr:hypothetical protein [Pirellulaceae bacterium]